MEWLETTAPGQKDDLTFVPATWLERPGVAGAGTASSTWLFVSIGSLCVRVFLQSPTSWFCIRAAACSENFHKRIVLKWLEYRSLRMVQIAIPLYQFPPFREL